MSPESQEDEHYKIISKKAKWLGVWFVIGLTCLLAGVILGILLNQEDVLMFHLFVIFPLVFGLGITLDFWLPNYTPKDFWGACKGEVLEDPILLTNRKRQGFYDPERLKTVKQVNLTAMFMVALGFWAVVIGSVSGLGLSPKAGTAATFIGLGIICFGISILLPSDYLYPEVSPMRPHH